MDADELLNIEKHLKVDVSDDVWLEGELIVFEDWWVVSWCARIFLLPVNSELSHGSLLAEAPSVKVVFENAQIFISSQAYIVTIIHKAAI